MAEQTAGQLTNPILAVFTTNLTSNQMEDWMPSRLIFAPGRTQSQLRYDSQTATMHLSVWPREAPDYPSVDIWMDGVTCQADERAVTFKGFVRNRDGSWHREQVEVCFAPINAEGVWE